MHAPLDPRIHAVLARDRSQDGAFVYAVTSTGIYCRPSCPSRRPSADRIRIYELPEAASAGGFRACKRCQPDAAAPTDAGLAAVRRACAAIARAIAEGEPAPELVALSRTCGLSPTHLQRRFAQAVGLSPKAYGDALRLGRLKEHLREGNGVADAVYAAGFGSGSRVYERTAQLGMTPATYAKGGKGAAHAYVIVPSPLGKLLVAASDTGIAAVSLGESERALAAGLLREFPDAQIRRDDRALANHVAAIVGYLEGRLPHPELPLDVRANAFQARVWQELLRIPAGETRTYAQVAAAIGAPGAVRAVGNACASNPAALVIPCHRVLRSDGALGGYRWGLARKEKLLAREKVPSPPRGEGVSSSGTDCGIRAGAAGTPAPDSRRLARARPAPAPPSRAGRS